MALEHDIDDVRTEIKAGHYENEAQISQGIVLRLLAALGWNIYHTRTVRSQLNIEGTFPDYVLCDPNGKQTVVIEVKMLGHCKGAEKQLFGYAVHKGVQLAILTDGQEWSFFLPGEQGDYDERCAYKLDIIEREANECTLRLSRYLKYEAVISGEALEAAREDLHNSSNERQIRATLPRAWAQLISGEDESLFKLVAERVANLCGHTPELETVASFLKANAVLAPTSQPPATVARPLRQHPPASAPVSPVPEQPRTTHGFELYGVYYPTHEAKDVLVMVFEELTRRDPTFPQKFASLPKHGRTRRYLARTPDDLFPKRKDFARDPKMFERLSFGWWVDTNVSNRSKVAVFKLACQAASLRYGKDLRVDLPNSSS